MKKSIWIVTLVIINAFSSFSVLAEEKVNAIKNPPNSSQSELESLRLKLLAQEKINAGLRKKMLELESQLANSGRTDVVVKPALDKNALPPLENIVSEENNTAIEQALVNKGVLLLAAKQVRIVPGFSWNHSGSGDKTYDSYRYGIGFDLGLPQGFMMSTYLPYVKNDYYYGSNSGVDDFSISLSKQLVNESYNVPGLIGRISYKDNNGKAPFDSVPIGSGFKSYTASLSTIKRLSPAVLYGGVYYSHNTDAHVNYLDGQDFDGKISPGDDYGFNLGASIAATPEITLDIGFSLSHYEKDSYFPKSYTSYSGTDATVGMINFGSNIMLKKNLFLSLSLGAGVTKDASDMVFSVAVPYLF